MVDKVEKVEKEIALSLRQIRWRRVVDKVDKSFLSLLTESQFLSLVLQHICNTVCFLLPSSFFNLVIPYHALSSCITPQHPRFTFYHPLSLFITLYHLLSPRCHLLSPLIVSYYPLPFFYHTLSPLITLLSPLITPYHHKLSLTLRLSCLTPSYCILITSYPFLITSQACWYPPLIPLIWNLKSEI